MPPPAAVRATLLEIKEFVALIDPSLKTCNPPPASKAVQFETMQSSRKTVLEMNEKAPPPLPAQCECAREASEKFRDDARPPNTPPPIKEAAQDSMRDDVNSNLAAVATPIPPPTAALEFEIAVWSVSWTFERVWP
mmetsp:Transcript_10129/g.33480  ORF Transcript_10129/g.33480 Transcript_10129/m.33480 type:complete len:136 (+) Transcript_10129:60-467(+)